MDRGQKPKRFCSLLNAFSSRPGWCVTRNLVWTVAQSNRAAAKMRDARAASFKVSKKPPAKWLSKGNRLCFRLAEC